MCLFFTRERKQHKLYQAMSEILMENILKANFYPFLLGDSCKSAQQQQNILPENDALTFLTFGRKMCLQNSLPTIS